MKCLKLFIGLSFCLFLFACTGVRAQGNDERTYLSSLDKVGFSIVEASNGDGYLKAGSMLRPGLPDEADIRVIRTDDSGAVLWERDYDSGGTERCLDVGLAPGGYIITGYIEFGGIRHMLLMRIDLTGNIVWQQIYSDTYLLTHSQGLQVTHTPADNGFIAVGFINTGDSTISDDRSALVLKTDSVGTPTWVRYIDTPSVNHDLDMAQQVQIVPGVGYFVSGSVNASKCFISCSGGPTSTDQAVLAVMLDNAGGLVWNRSFTSQPATQGGHWETAIGATIDNPAQRIYLISNNTIIHDFAMTVFDFAGTLIADYDYNSGFMFERAAYHVIESQDPDHVVVAGHIRSIDFSLEESGGVTSYFDNSPPFLVELEKNTGQATWNRLYPVPSTSVQSFGSGPFAMFFGQQPFIHTKEMVTATDDGGYALTASRNNLSPYIDLELIKTDPTGAVNCFMDRLIYATSDRDRYFIPDISFTNGVAVSPGPLVASSRPVVVADCGVIQSNQCHLDISFTYTVDTNSCEVIFTGANSGTTPVLNWNWNFGDTSSGAGQVTSHIYSGSGSYTVCLDVLAIINNQPCTQKVCGVVDLACVQCDCEVAALASWVATDCTVRFQDLSTFSPCTSASSWAWSFGDGNTSTMQNPSHTYTSPGAYTVCLTVQGTKLDGTACEDTYCFIVQVDCPWPCEVDPAFTCKPKGNGMTINFTDGSTMNLGTTLVGYYWDFGDGNTSTLPNPSHTYSTPGTYTVCLTIFWATGLGTDLSDCCNAMVCKTIQVFKKGPCKVNANFYTLGLAGSSSFVFVNTSTAGGSSTITGFFWDFGDGNTSTAASPSHTYASPGTYTVCLIVTATNGIFECAKKKCHKVKIKTPKDPKL